ncbi:MAG: membrane protein insertase YidC, partial [Pseudonocardiaceae bacterium]
MLLQWHHLFNLIGLDKDSGLNWALSIVFLVITARLLLFRLFIKQVKYQRHMQQMQPEIQKIRKKYKDDKTEMQRQMMALQQAQGFNPLSGCLPMFLQFPIFIALYHVLRHLSNSVTSVHVLQQQGAGALSPGQAHQLTLYTFTQAETASAATARLFGAPL